MLLPPIPAPFAPAHVRDRNQDRDDPPGHTERCLFCERAMNPTRVAYFVHMTTAGMIVPADATDVEDSQGCFPVGTSCKSLVPEPYRITKKKNPELFRFL